MARENVTVIDQTGRLLSKSLDDPASILTDTQLQHRMRLEGIYRSRIESLVTPIVGPGNVNAQVNIEIDFTRSEVTEERVDPEGTALRSEQNTLDVAANAEARGVPGATANTAPTEGEIADGLAGTAGATQTENRSSSELRNYEVSRRVSTTMAPSNRIIKIDAALLLRTQMVIDPETGLEQPQSMSPEAMADIERLVSSAIGLNPARGDTLTVTAKPFVSTLEGVSVSWFQTDWIQQLAKQFVTVLLLAVITLGVIRPLLNRVLVPSGGGAMGHGGLTEEEAEALESVEVGDGETLEDIKAKLKPKKSNISLEMLDTANTYDDKVAIIRMIVGDEAGRVSNVFKQMMKKELDQKA
jgi:flagellar M-ring protein FliF